MDKFTALQEFGLNEREAKTYLVMLEWGPATASAIAKHSGMLRPTAYDVLDEMARKGVVTHSIGAGKKIFAAVEPRILQQLLDTKRKILSDFIPELEELSKVTAAKPQIEIYAGASGIKNVFEDIIVVGADVYQIFNYDMYEKRFASYFTKNHIAKRMEKGIHYYGITNRMSIIEQEDLNTQRLREIRYLESLSALQPMLFTYGDKCGFFTFDETPMAVLITNKTIASSFRLIFNILWNEAKEQQTRARKKVNGARANKNSGKLSR